LTPARGDIAADRLRGRVDAKKYVSGAAMQVSSSRAGLRKAADVHAEQLNQALFGETITVYDVADGWAWGQLDYDGYVGWMSLSALRDNPVAATHRVGALRTHVFERPDMKSPPLMALSMGARLSVVGEEGPWLRVAGSGWVFAGHAVQLAATEPDYVAVAERFVGTPYLWGGRESLGLDCSGLVQVSLAASGIDVLRDSDMQATTVGASLDPLADYSNLRRGDLVFWSGHVAIMLDATRMIHASGRSMSVEIEPLTRAVARITPISGPVKVVRRLAG
jgi:cell wall-associated NlpC family hydrolase